MNQVMAIVRPAPSGVDPASLEVLAAARGLGDVVALWLTEDPVPADVLAEHGARRIVRIPLPEAARWLNSALAACVLSAADHVRPDAILFGPSHAARDLAGRVAALSGSGVVTDAREVAWGADGLEVSSAVLGGEWEVRSVIGTPAIVTMAAGAADATPAPVAHHIEELPVPPLPGHATLLTRQAAPRGERPEVDSARVVIVGGRGTNGDFSLVEQLADLLGGAVGATRVAVDEGWADHRLQVGQTGAQIAPALYVGLGVSGAIHHTSGMRASRTIVAINEDSAAPIFEIADAGIVGDLGAVTPLLIAGLRRRLG